jgi:hypothetical protein
VSVLLVVFGNVLRTTIGSSFFFFFNKDAFCFKNLPHVKDIIMLLPVPKYVANIKSLHTAPIRNPVKIKNRSTDK